MIIQKYVVNVGLRRIKAVFQRAKDLKTGYNRCVKIVPKIIDRITNLSLQVARSFIMKITKMIS
jgi:hypothetical protein